MADASTPAQPAALPFDDRLVDDMLTWQEGHFLDFKRIRDKLQSALEAAVAFANTDGGWIIFGVEDPDKGQGRDRVYGIEENPTNLDEFQRLLGSRITPPLAPRPLPTLVQCTLRNGQRGTIAFIRVHKSPMVHSIIEDGTFARLEKSNKELTAPEITELCFARGTVTAESQPETRVDIELLDTPYWRAYADSRRLTRPLRDALYHLGLARRDAEGVLHPTRAAVLLFAEDPSAVASTKAAIRVFHYSGLRAELGPAPNLVRPPRTITGPLVAQVTGARDAVMDALAQGVRIGPHGFEIVQRYPVRVILEAITNAVIHRDYHIPADIHIRVFGDRIEVESPGRLPGGVTPANITQVQFSRNPSIVNHLREFPNPPNLDAGEGTRMMFATMQHAGLYSPLYFTPPAFPREAVCVVMLSLERPSVWDRVSSFLEKQGAITNAQLRQIMATDNTLAASKLLRAWVEQGLLAVVNPDAAKQHRRYAKPFMGGELPLFSGALGKQRLG